MQGFIFYLGYSSVMMRVGFLRLTVIEAKTSSLFVRFVRLFGVIASLGRFCLIDLIAWFGILG